MLSDVWRDIISIGGFLLTIAGLLYTMRQVWLAKSAAEAAKNAADRTLDESRKSFQRYIAANAHRFINEAKMSIENEQWAAAAMRLRDLADQLAQLTGLSLALEQLRTAARRWAEDCSRRASGKLK